MRKTDAKSNEIAGNHGPSAAQGPTTKQHAIEVLKHTHTSSYMINIQIAIIVDLSKWILTLQK